MKACNEYNTLSRRDVVGGAMKLGMIAALSTPAWMPRMAFAQSQNSARDILIQVFLRGGMDGLSLCPPHGDPLYYQRRPTIAVPQPGSGSPRAAVNLNGYFGLHPALQPLMPAYQAGQLLIVHATGAVANQWTRSHFDAMRWMELGRPNDITLYTGWIGRHLQSVPAGNGSAPLRGMAIADGLPLSLAGAPLTLPIPDPTSFKFADGWDNRLQLEAYLRANYQRAPGVLKSAALASQNTEDMLDTVGFANYQPAGGAVYPDNDFGKALRATAALVRAEVGLETICIDRGDWDTHSGQGTTDGHLNELFTEIGQGLAAFHADMNGANFNRYTVVVMSEFGRNVWENGSQGCDHGTGNAMLLMGPHVLGGRVFANWPGLGLGQLFEEQDLMPTTDYRDVAAEIVAKRLANTSAIGSIFPGYTPTFRGLVAA
jgi:uncharacterized protein (DUF1501 family)